MRTKLRTHLENMTQQELIEAMIEVVEAMTDIMDGEDQHMLVGLGLHEHRAEEITDLAYHYLVFY